MRIIIQDTRRDERPKREAHGTAQTNTATNMPFVGVWTAMATP